MPQRIDVASSWRTWTSRQRDFEDGCAGAKTVADAQGADIDAARGEVLAQGAVEDRITASGQAVDDSDAIDRIV
jgi:hypothetical protein